MNDQWHAYSPHAQTEIFICVFFISSVSSTLYFIATWLLHIPCELLQLISQSQTIMLCKLLGKKRSYWIDYCTAAFVVHVHIQGIVQQSSDGNSGWFLQWKSTMQLAIACACTTPCMGGKRYWEPTRSNCHIPWKMSWLWAFSKNISSGAQYVTLRKYFSHPSLVMYSFCNPTNKTETGTASK
jgi:hypothetical protein